ncbi:MAG TPA: MBL fold metallo-hydrolase [Pyrinomonadaceae bacterium]|nr:MBL fold metallo-hydrolase [Pyrinomonadaceae bacterium]
MKKVQIERDIYVLRGETFESNATVLIKDDEVLLIDALASRKDAETLRYFIEEELKKEVRFILCTHFMSDHLAGLKSFPGAQIIAHENYRQTFVSQRSLTDEEASFFVEPTMTFSDRIKMKWGRLTLDIFHNPSHTMSTIGIDIPEADLLFVGDAFFGSTVFLSSAGIPEQIRGALKQLKTKNRSRVVPGHIGIYDNKAFENALFYLNSLQTQVETARNSPAGEKAVLEIPIDNCLAPAITASEFEKEFHAINLRLIVERKLFLSDAEFCLN